MFAISIKDLYYRNGRITLSIDELNIKEGIVTGIYAAKRSGKSTLMRFIANFAEPKKGSIKVLGGSLSDDAKIRSSVAYVSNELGFIPSTKISTVIKHYKRFFPELDEKLLDTLLSSFSISKTARLNSLSTAHSLKLSYSLALARHPRLLLVDGLTGEVDPIVTSNIMATIKPHLDKDLSFVFTTSRIGDLEKYAEDVVILESGSVKTQIIPEDYCQNCYIFSGKYNSVHEDVIGLRINDGNVDFMVDNEEQMQKIKAEHPSLNVEKATKAAALAYLIRGGNIDE